jgi:hypothetical protein
MTKKKRAKNEPTQGDLLAQAYRNRAAMQRVFEAAVHGNRNVNGATIQRYYWTPRNMNEGVN